MSDIFELINNSSSILVITHEKPDGDAIGSVIAFYHYLNNIGKNVQVLIPELPPIFSFLCENCNIISKSDDSYDLAIVCDCSSKERIGQTNDEFDRCKSSIVIDHHVTNTNYGDINYVLEKVSSCCQIIYYLFKEHGANFTINVTEALMTGVLTDTSGFANDNVDKDTFRMMADLFDVGANFHSIYYNVLSKRNKAQVLLAELTLKRLEFFEDGKIAFSYITKEDFNDVGAVLGDHEGLVDIGRNVEGVEVSIFIREDDGYRVSFRSNGKVNVNDIATKFGGGGHKMAAGALINKNFKETKKLLINETIKELNA